MSELFIKILNMSISATWMMLAVMFVRLIMKKAPRRIICFLWALVAVRLIIPFSIENALSLIPSKETIPANISIATNPAINSGIRVINEAVNPVITQTFTPAQQASVNPIRFVITAAGVIWAIGVASLIIYAIVSYIRIRRSVSASLNLNDNIMVCDDIKSPFVLGIIKPVIYIPSGLDDKSVEMVIAHEKSHIRRRDHWWKPLGFLLLSVYWFNPFCWIGYILLCRDIEAACDEKVIMNMSNSDRAAYSQALLDCSFSRRIVAACPVAFGETNLNGRVKEILRYKKPAIWLSAVAIAMSLVLASLRVSQIGLHIRRHCWTAASQEES